MPLSSTRKCVLYHELHRYVHAGLDLPRAIDSFLTERSASSVRQTMQRIHDRLSRGSSVEQAFTDPAFSKVEQAMIGAAERSGRLDQAMSYLSQYFQTLADTSRTIWQNVSYPIFLVHFAAIILPIPKLVTEGVSGYFIRVGATLAAVYGVALTVWGICWLLARISEKEPSMDAVVQTVPVIGWARRNLALARFFASLEMLVNAGIGLPEALSRAAGTTRSSFLESSVRKALPEIERGVPADQALRSAGAFPEQVLRGMKVGLDTGSLDIEMGRWGAFYWQKAQDGIRSVSKWVPRIIYLIIVLGIAIQIVSVFQSIMDTQSKFLDGL